MSKKLPALRMTKEALDRITDFWWDTTPVEANYAGQDLDRREVLERLAAIASIDVLLLLTHIKALEAELSEALHEGGDS